jgi:hypothetical protein
MPHAFLALEIGDRASCLGWRLGFYPRPVHVDKGHRDVFLSQYFCFALSAFIPIHYLSLMLQNLRNDSR